MEVALPVVAGFALGLAVRGALQRHFAVAFRALTASALPVIAFLAAWSFDAGMGNTAALGVLLAAQLSAVALGARGFRAHPDGPLLSFSLFGNPGFWSVPVTAAVFGTRAAVTVAAYDMLTQPRLAPALRRLRGRAPVSQNPRTALADYAPMAAAVAGLATGRLVPAPGGVPPAAVVLAIGNSALGAVLLGVAWPRGGWLGAAERRLAARVLALHLTFVPAVLAAAALAGLAIPPGAWILALGPLPIASLSFARLYGYSPRQAACGLVLSVGVAVALLPVAWWLGTRLSG